MRVWILLLAVALANSGCFVLDEIEKGQELMATHSPDTPASASGQAESAEKPQTPRERLAEYYAKQRAKAKSRAEKTASADAPGDAVGSCKVGGSTQFMRRSDCELRGGTFL
jgi:hypothetical protein